MLHPSLCGAGAIGLIRVGFVWRGGPTPNPLPSGKGLKIAVRTPLPWREGAGG